MTPSPHGLAVAPGRLPAAIVVFLGVSLACAHPSPAPGSGLRSAAHVQTPANPVNVLDVTIEGGKLTASPKVAAGQRTVEFFNATESEWMCRVEGPGSTWKLDRPVPPNKAIAIDLVFTEGDYLLACTAGKRELGTKLQVTGS